jgi:cell division protein FtsW (lipid II flippase)
MRSLAQPPSEYTVPLSPPSSLLTLLIQLAVVWAMALAGWGIIAQQRGLLLSRLPATTVERFVADQVAAQLPTPVPVAELASLCGPDAQANNWAWWPARQRQAMAQCLAERSGATQPADHDTAHAAATTVGNNDRTAQQPFVDALKAQASAAQRWLDAYDQQAPTIRQKLGAELVSLQIAAPGPLASFASLGELAQQVPGLPTGAAAPRDTRQPMGRDGLADAAVVAQMRNALARARQLLAQAAPGAPTSAASAPAADTTTLALLATGLTLTVDASHNPPKVALVPDRQSLADVLAWQHRAQGYAERGFGLTRLLQAGDALLLGAALVLVVATITGQAPLVWALAGLALGASHLLMLDLALTGPAALRYLAERQFVGLQVGPVWLNLLAELPTLPAWPAVGLQHAQPITLAGGPVLLWWPLVAVAGVLALLRAVRTGQSWLFAPLRAWVGWGDHTALRVLQMAVLAALAGGALVGLGMAAAVSEFLVLLACVGVATYWARQAAMANVHDGFQAYSAWAVLAAVAVAVGLSLQRGDLGHALVALAVGLLFVFLFGGVVVRWVLAAVVLAGAGLLGASLWQGHLLEPLQTVVAHLPGHGRERFMALFDPFTAASSDLARVHWLMDSAGWQGWGPGYVPWQGIAKAGAMDNLPLQGPSDYVLGILVATWGAPLGVGLLGLAAAAFVLAAGWGVRVGTRTGQATSVRWLAAVGALGAVVMAFKLIISVGGVVGFLPLTGLPVALLGYGPVTHFAALAYLVLAVGLVHVQPSAEPAKGVNLVAAQARAGHLAQRATALVGAGAVACAALLGLTVWMLLTPLGGASTVVLPAAFPAGRPAAHPSEHLARQRFETARLVAAHLQTGGSAPKALAEADYACPELHTAVNALQSALAARADGQGRHLNVAGLLAQGLQQHSCTALAQHLARLVQTDVPKTVGVAAPSTHSTTKASSPATKPTVVARADFATPNAWWGQPGCIRLGAGAATAGSANAASRDDCSDTSPPGQRWSDAITDPWLLDGLGARLPVLTRTPSGTTTLNHRAVPKGQNVALTLDPTLQALASLIANCYTGQQRGEACAAVLPQDTTWRQRHFEGPSMRAGVLGMTVLDADTGQLLASAGAVSACSANALSRAATPLADGRTPVLREGEACAQVPDRRSTYLQTYSPAHWLVPPGSSLKPWVFAAAVDSGLVPATEQAHWLQVLAESHDQQTVERTALAAQRRWLTLLADTGFAQPWVDMLTGTPSASNAPAQRTSTGQATAWRVQSFDGLNTLKPSSMSPLMAEQIRADIRRGVGVDKKYGRPVMESYLAAQGLAAASIGGGDLRINTLGLAQAWMQMDRTARGLAGTARPHLVGGFVSGAGGQGADSAALSATAANRALQATRGVTASRYKGTAQGSCRVVFGACPPDGVPGLSGKTGTADVLEAERSPYLKRGETMPSRLFGGVFSAQGRRLAVAVMTTRVREGYAGGNKASLEHSPSAAAEAALTLARQMGVRP